MAPSPAKALPLSTSAAATTLRNLNPDIKIDFLYSAILDKKSSGKCFTRHNKKVFKELKGEMSPIHYRCRTRMIPFIGTDEAPKQESINRWFTGLSELEKIEFLGKKKFEVFNKNKKSFNLLRDFISEDSEIYTLKQLKNKGVLVES